MMTLYKPLELSRDDIEILEELIFSKRVFPLSDTKPSVQIRFVLPPVSTNETMDFFLPLKANQQKIYLTLHPTTESNFIKCLATFGGKEAIPKDFFTAVIAFCSRKIMAVLETFLQVPISIEEQQEKNKEVKGKKICFEIINQNGVVEIQGELELPQDLLKKFLSMAATHPRLERVDLGNFPLLGELIIGNTALSFLEWNKLRPGDLIFFEEPTACSTGECFFQIKTGSRLLCLVDIKQLQSLILPLKQVASSGFVPLALSDVGKTTKEEEELASLGKLVTIELAFSAATFSLTIDEIIHLAKTNKLPHSFTLNRPLKILAQGKPIGAGELVELHGQHALFITQLILKK